MNEQTVNELNSLRRALRALAKSVTKVLVTETYEGTGDMLIKSYRRLQAKALEILPDDFYIDALELEIGPDMNDRQKAAQVQVSANQMMLYVEHLLRDERPLTANVDDFRNLGMEIRDQIVQMTRNTLKNAFSHIDIGVNDEEDMDFDAADSEKKRVKVKIKVHDDNGEAADGEPPQTI